MEAIDNKEYQGDDGYTEEEIVDEDMEFEAEAPVDISGDGYTENKKVSIKELAFDLLFYILIIFTAIYIIPNYVLQRTIVDGSSMAETLHDGEHLFVEKLSYRFDALDRFDIIVFYPYGRENEEYYVKRIIGMPGETIQIIGSDIYINGEILEERYGKDPITDPGRAAVPITLSEDEYFVMGDNRSVSKDSRTVEVGNVNKENIGGRAVFRIKPLSRFGTID
ncbi:MAG: hypothetical protein K0R34_2595 [Herbinix sp.]|jgi:signal peptidase I|nr:hypothetical protein [Herbinix sp.]